MRYWVASKACGCILSVMPNKPQPDSGGRMVNWPEDLEAFAQFTRQHDVLSRLTAEEEDVPGTYIAVGPCPEHRETCPNQHVAAPLEEKPRNEAEEVVGPTCRTAWGNWLAGENPGKSPPSGAGESERRGMGIQATETFTDEEGRILASAGPNGVALAANGFKTREEAAQNLRALADALDGGPKRHRKAKNQ